MKQEDIARLNAIGFEEIRWHVPGEDNETIEIGIHPSGARFLRSRNDLDRILRYTEKEWNAFVRGARDGEFGVD